MATLGDLKARIISETVRDDLADDMASDLNTIIRKSIEQYAYERWWFNEIIRTTACVPGNDHATFPGSEPVPVPPRTLVLDDVWLLVGGVRYRLRVLDTASIISLYSTPQTGQPTDYAVDGESIWLWPKPTQAYPLMWELISEVTPALDYANDASSNVWTNQGQDLITARSKLRLYRDYLSATTADSRFQGADAQEAEAYSRLRAESNRRLTTGKVSAGW